MKSRRPVRVSFLIDRLSHGGTESQLVALIQHLDRKVVQPNLVLLNGNEPESKSLEPSDCPVLRLGLTHFRDPLMTTRSALRLRRYWKAHQVDVVQTYFLDSTYFGVPVARACGIKRVIRVRNNISHWLTPKHAAIGRIMGRLAHRTLTNSEPGRMALWRAEGGNQRKLVVLENGVNLERFSHLPEPKFGSRITIGCLANLRPVKGIDLLVRAAKIVKDKYPNVRFVVAGEGDQRPQLEQLIRHLDLTGQFDLPGQTSDVPGFLSEIDLAVLPSRAEGMSNAILEYMASGRPIVATDVGANRRMLDNGNCGVIVPPNDVTAFAHAIERLITNPTHSQRLAHTAQNHVARQYSRSAMSERFEQFYMRLCA